MKVEELLSLGRRAVSSFRISGHEQEDLVQEAVLAVLETCPKEERKGLLFRIMRNRIVDIYRYEVRRKTVALQDSVEEIRLSSTGSTGHLAKQVLEVQTSSKAKDFLETFCKHDCSFSEMAQALGTPQATLRSQWHRLKPLVRRDCELGGILGSDFGGTTC